MNKKNNTKKGFTLVELIISIFIFLLVVTTIVSIFARYVLIQNQARTMKNDLEGAQFAINFVTKTLRTSSILGYLDGNNYVDLMQEFKDNTEGQNDFLLKEIETGQGLIIYDFSQEACVRFTFKDKTTESDYAYPALWMETVKGVSVYDLGNCLTNIWSGTDYKKQRLTTGEVTGSFLVAPTRYNDLQDARTTNTIGRATITFQVQPQDASKLAKQDPVYIQTSVSLRDYPSDISF